MTNRRRMIRDIFKAGGTALTAWAGVVILVVGMAAMWVFGVGLFQRETADFRGDVDVAERTEGDAGFRIAAYDRFFALCAAVQADEGRIANMETELDQDISEDRREQLQASLTGVRNSRSEKIAEYNAAARSEYTAGQFRDSDLPFTLHADTEETQCAAS